MVVEQKAVFDKGAKRLIFNNAKKNPTFKRNKILLILGGIILIGVGVLRVTDVILPGVHMGYGIAMIVLGVVLFGLLIATYIFLWRKVNNDSKAAMDVNVTYKLDENGLRTRTNVGRRDFAWNQLQVKEHEGYIEVIVAREASSVFLKKEKLKEKEIKWLLSNDK